MAQRVVRPDIFNETLGFLVAPLATINFLFFYSRHSFTFCSFDLQVKEYLIQIFRQRNNKETINAESKMKDCSSFLCSSFIVSLE